VNLSGRHRRFYRNLSYETTNAIEAIKNYWHQSGPAISWKAMRRLQFKTQIQLVELMVKNGSEHGHNNNKNDNDKCVEILFGQKHRKRRKLLKELALKKRRTSDTR
jgi:hypothetical protein